MAHQTLQLTENLYEYMQQTLIREPAALKNLREKTENQHWSDRQISPEQGQLISFLLETINARYVLEIGTLRGYSALAAAMVIPDSGKIITCDVNKEFGDVAIEAWEKAGVKNKIEFHLRPAVETLEELTANGLINHFDFAFIDADKENHLLYYESILPLVRQGGIIMIDNVFWEGAVADLAQSDDEVDTIRKLNDLLHTDERVSTSILPIGDGVILARKR